MITLTRPMRESLFRKWKENNQGLTYRQFRRTVEPGFNYILVPWCGMYLGIEPDGHTHS